MHLTISVYINKYYHLNMLYNTLIHVFLSTLINAHHRISLYKLILLLKHVIQHVIDLRCTCRRQGWESHKEIPIFIQSHGGGKPFIFIRQGQKAYFHTSSVGQICLSRGKYWPINTEKDRGHDEEEQLCRSITR